MARLLHPDIRFDTSQYQPTETEILQPAQALQLKGMDRMLPLNLLDPGMARLVRNLCIRNGAYETRDAVSQIGSPAASSVIYALDVGLSGVFIPTRWYTTGIDVFVTGTWVTITAPGGWTGDDTKPFAFSAWGDTLMFAAGIGKVFSLIFQPGFVVSEITGSPLGVIHLATFGTRAVAVVFDSGTGLGQVQWTVRGDNTDWSGLGSGFEDLRSAPGGRPDQPTAVVPITDETAYHVRTNSIWQMTITGDFDAPFAFNRLYEFIGSRYPQLCTAITRGLICVDDQHIWMITAQGVKDIAIPIMEYLDAAQAVLSDATATYDPVWREYRLVLPANTALNQRILRYSIEFDAWTEDVGFFPIKSIAYTLFTPTGPNTSRPNMIYSVGDGANIIVRDDFTQNNAGPGTGLTRNNGFRVETGDLRRTDASLRKELVEAILWYEAQASVTLYFEYSTDGGTTWLPLSSLVYPATTRPTPISIYKTIDRDYIQLAVYTDVTPKVRLIKLEAMIREAGKITDAH